MRPSRLPVPILLSAVVFTACLSGSDFTTTPQDPGIDCATLATGLDAAAPTLTTTSSGLKYRDVVIGNGTLVTKGQVVALNYAGCLTNGGKFDQVNVTRPSDAFQFKVGLDTPVVIKGFDEGILGMHVGGRRQLVIPPDLAYGSTGKNAIPPNATLVFTVDLLAAQ